MVAYSLLQADLQHQVARMIIEWQTDRKTMAAAYALIVKPATTAFPDRWDPSKAESLLLYTTCHPEIGWVLSSGEHFLYEYLLSGRSLKDKEETMLPALLRSRHTHINCRYAGASPLVRF